MCIVQLGTECHRAPAGEYCICVSLLGCVQSVTDSVSLGSLNQGTQIWGLPGSVLQGTFGSVEGYFHAHRASPLSFLQVPSYQDTGCFKRLPFSFELNLKTLKNITF